MKAEIDQNCSKLCMYDVGCSYNKDDYISALLINDYKAYILSLESKKRINRYEFIMNEYLTNKEFNIFIHENQKEITDYISDTQYYLINKYNEYILRKPKSRWL